ncbi:AI-2E family transporter [Pontibacter sp. E15-1]|uniref:AI-2E family transporter n=1 Tax=Pontibacter sp. E15-1 TaxID=2919918 RepID=UPI001F4F9B87|nr:AI-2E family transporter [Pontibacter sp. E15-1]MCJ8164491.1 AI-2E family transporter [Pontibacter sp. E15-1]
MNNRAQINWLKWLQYTLLIAVLLYFGRTLFIPLSFALLISFVLYPICRWLERKKLPRWSAITVCLLLLLVLVGAPVFVLMRQVVRFTEEWPLLQQKLLRTWADLSEYLSQHLGFDAERQLNWTEKVAANATNMAFSMVQDILYTSAVSVVLLVLIPLYVALILYNREQLAKALYALFPAGEHKKVQQVLHETITTYYNFIKGMFIVYVVVAILNSVGLLLLGIPHALFFGVIASILTFIPYVGITIGAVLPMAVAWITYDSVWYPFGVVLVFTGVQYLEANIIFPWAVSYRLQVNMLFTLLAIVAGGILWGASGMILFIPFLAILKLVADKYTSMRPISLLLGNK